MGRFCAAGYVDNMDELACPICLDLKIKHITTAPFPGPLISHFEEAARQCCAGCNIIAWIATDYLHRCTGFADEAAYIHVFLGSLIEYRVLRLCTEEKWFSDDRY